MLAAGYPDAHCALDFSNAFELLIATVLSAQCTDKRVNEVTPHLFARFPTAAAMAEASPEELEELIRPTGFYRNKAKAAAGIALALCEQYGGEVPGTLKELTALPGVGRKTANVVLGNAFDVPGLTVDTHFGRCVRRLELTEQSDPVKVESVLAEQLRTLAEERAPGVPAAVLGGALIAWTQLFGMISFELFGQLVGSVDPSDEFFVYACARTATLAGLPPS